MCESLSLNVKMLKIDKKKKKKKFCEKNWNLSEKYVALIAVFLFEQ